MFKKIFTLTVSFLLLGLAVMAQNGKIAGRVLDSETGDPLIGANVFILDTDYGAATDVNGEYMIPNVPPGDYSIRASYIGYQNVTIQNIRVVSGLTQEVNFPLPSTSFATEEVVIVSERPLIEKSSTSAVRIVDAEALQSLPTRNLTDIAALQPGVVLQNDLISIRGSRPDETGYFLEGANVKNVMSRDGGSIITVIPDAVQEMLVHAGGYNAEFGGSNAGIIQQNLKTGKESYHFTARAETDNFGNYPGDKFLGTYSYGYSDYVLTASGPAFTNKIKFFLSAENSFRRDLTPTFWEGSPKSFSDGSLLDTTKVFDTGYFGGDKNDYEYLKWDAGNVPGTFQNRYTFNGTMLIDLDPLLLKVSSAYSSTKRRGSSIPTLMNIFNLGRLPITDYSNFMLNLKGTYFVSNSTFLEANVTYTDYRAKRYDPYFEDDVLAYSDSLAASKYGWDFASYNTDPVAYDFYGFPFYRPGAVLTNYLKQENSYIGGSFSFTSQYKDHEIKGGGSLDYYTQRYYYISYASVESVNRNIRNYPNSVRDKESTLATLREYNFSNFNNYGYDLFGAEVDDDDSPYAPKHPIFGSAYIQDKYESDDLVINFGLRYDYIDMDSWTLVDPESPVYDPETNLIPDSAITEGGSYEYVSPRLGFSFPVTDQTVFHVQYGKFVQSPSLDLSYRGMHQAATQLIGGYAFSDPIAYDLEPEKTTQYEIGFSQQFSDFAAFDITAFYKDIRGLPVYAFQEVEAGSQIARYAVYTNQDFSTTKGLELSLKTRRVERVRAEVNYTYSDAQGTNSFAGSGFGSVQTNGNVPTVIVPLDYNQTHRGSIAFDYRFGEGEGGPILERFGLNLLFTFNSGHPFTYAQFTGVGQQSPYLGVVVDATDTRQRRPDGPVNSSTTPWVYNLDLRIDKTVSIFDFDVNFYVYVQNLLNTKSVINVYDHTGNAHDDGFLSSEDAETIIDNSRYTQRFADLYRAINLGNRQHYLYQKGYDIYDEPRQLRVGVMIDF